MRALHRHRISLPSLFGRVQMRRHVLKSSESTSPHRIRLCGERSVQKGAPQTNQRSTPFFGFEKEGGVALHRDREARSWSREINVCPTKSLRILLLCGHPFSSKICRGAYTVRSGCCSIIHPYPVCSQLELWILEVSYRARKTPASTTHAAVEYLYGYMSGRRSGYLSRYESSGLNVDPASTWTPRWGSIQIVNTLTEDPREDAVQSGEESFEARRSRSISPL